MSHVEQFLSKISNLYYFKLIAQGYLDLIDGQKWELLVSHLTIFNFRLHLPCSLPDFSKENILDSFCSLFWLEQKCWFVVYDGPYSRNIFMVPRFTSNILVCPNIYWPSICISSNFCFDKYIHQVDLSLFNPII